MLTVFTAFKASDKKHVPMSSVVLVFFLVFVFGLFTFFLRQAALERGEKLGELEEKTDRMRMNAESFGQMASQVKNKYKNKKWYQF